MKGFLHEVQGWVKDSRLLADTAFDGVSTDSRTLQPGNLFVALKGENFDAHLFLNKVIEKQAAGVVAEYIPPGYELPALLVKNSRSALGEIAMHWRSRFKLPLIAVTGSNGKTTVKEMIAGILKVAYGNDSMLATQGNLNNDVGVPHTLFRLNESHQAAVVELGMNHRGEIAELAAMAQPTVALVNNAQREHIEFMETVEAVAEENGSVINALPETGTAVFPAADPYTALWHDYAGSRKSMTFGLDASADVSGHYDEAANTLEITATGESRRMNLPVLGRHNAMNALAAAACCLAIGIGLDSIIQGLSAFTPVKGRLQVKPGPNGVSIIDDTYNANPDSVLAAIDVLALRAAPRLLVLGDMGEVGTNGEAFHEEIGRMAREKGISSLYALGTLAAHAAAAFGEDARHFDNMDALLTQVDQAVEPGATVLVKGSRFMKMERVVDYLMEKAR